MKMDYSAAIVATEAVLNIVEDMPSPRSVAIAITDETDKILLALNCEAGEDKLLMACLLAKGLKEFSLATPYFGVVAIDRFDGCPAGAIVIYCQCDNSTGETLLRRAVGAAAKKWPG